MIRFIKSLRNSLLKKTIWRKYSIGDRFHAGRNTKMWAKNSITIGDDFYFGAHSQIGCDVIIGDGVLFGSYVSLVGRNDHDIQHVGVPIRRSRSIRDEDFPVENICSVSIGSDVWVGHRSIILSGARIADGTIIGAGSVVVGDTEPYSIYVGVPAKKIRSRFDSAADLARHLSLLES